MNAASIILIAFCSLLSRVHALHPAGGSFLNPEGGQIWAVLVAGSDTWDNYRHQADVCHSYQILHNHGIPDERIIVMMTDDLAHNSQNPTPGVIINHPDGEDVYKGVPHDYTGEEVTPENFLAVLRGDKESLRGRGSGKVLQSGPNDNVFVYFADHGAPGLIAFPESELTAKQLNKTIQHMYKNKMYNKMVIYIEACESGSMFKNILPKHINVYATTAANAIESSYACYFDEQRETYLGDVYSVNWMEDSDKENLSKETLKKQFKIVKKETNTSHVQEYGDLTIGNLKVSEFQGRKESNTIIIKEKTSKADAVPNRDATLESLKQKLKRASSDQEKKKIHRKLRRMIKNREFLALKMKHFAKTLVPTKRQYYDIWTKRSELSDLECYDEARQYFQDKCFKLSKNQYALQYLYVLVNLCENGFPAEMQKRAMEKVCNHLPVEGIH